MGSRRASLIAAAALAACGSDFTLEVVGEPGTPVNATFVSGIPAIPGSVGGGPEQWFLVDTGAPFTALDTDAYAFPDGLRTVSLAGFGVEFPTLDAVVFDVLSTEGSQLPIGGLVGGDVLSFFAVTVDRAGGQAWLDGPLEGADTLAPLTVAGDVKGGGRGAVPGSCPRGCGTVELPPSRFLVTATVEDLDEPVRLLVDTGASEVVFTDELLDRLGDAGRPRLDGVTVSTAVGPVVAYLTRVWEVDLGNGARRASVPALVLPDPDFFRVLDDEVGEHVDGIIGQGLLRHFVYTVDYPARELHLAAYPDDSHLPPGEYASLGFTLELVGGDWQTATIEPGSDAEAQGVMVGEIVSAIDGEPLAGLDAAAINQRIESMTPGDTAVVTLDRAGIATELTLEVLDLLPPFNNPGGS